MIQLSIDFFANDKNEKQTELSVETLRRGLEEHIKVTGLIAFKDFFIKLKQGAILTPAGITKEDYLALAREVYEKRSAQVDRNKNRAKYFAIRNKMRLKSA